MSQETKSEVRAKTTDPSERFVERGMREFGIGYRIVLAVVIGIVAAFTKVVWHWSWKDKEKLLDATSDQGAVIVMNHVSMLDPITVICMMYARGRRVRPIYKSEFDKHRIVGWLFTRVAGGISVGRGTADIKAVRHAQHALERGESVLIYPEGTRIKSDDQPVEVHGGFALMAQLARASVVPCAIVGARDITPAGARFSRPFKRVFVAAGDAITFDQIDAKGRKAQAQAMESLACERMYELRDELRREHPGKM